VPTFARGTAVCRRRFRASEALSLLHVRSLDGVPLRADVCLGLVGPKDRFELIGRALVRGAIVGVSFGVAVRIRSN